MTAIPPPRWKVVERGRRLEVIDTRAVPERTAARNAGVRPGLPRRLRFDGTLGWATHPFYDGRGPRAVVLDGALARWVGGVAAAALVAAVLLVAIGGPSVAAIGAAALIVSWGAIKASLTRQLDRIAVP